MKICRHCAVPIRSIVWASGPGWIHEDGGIWCLRTTAEPPEQSLAQQTAIRLGIPG